MLFKIIGVGLVSVVLTLVLKNQRQEFSVMASVCGGLVIFALAMDGLKEIFSEMFELTNVANINSETLIPIIKVVGVGYITEFVCDIADDCGNKILSNKVEHGVANHRAYDYAPLPVLEAFVCLHCQLVL